MTSIRIEKQETRNITNFFLFYNAILSSLFEASSSRERITYYLGVRGVVIGADGDIRDTTLPSFPTRSIYPDGLSKVKAAYRVFGLVWEWCFALSLPSLACFSPWDCEGLVCVCVCEREEE